jgi:DNA-binding CsgD family transcriptional regulator
VELEQLDELHTVQPGSSGAAHRAEALHRLRLATDAHTVYFFQLADGADGPVMTNVEVVGNSKSCAVIGSTDGRPAPAKTVAPGRGNERFDVTRPLRRQRNAFVELRRDYPDWDTYKETLPPYQNYYALIGMTDQVRMLVYDRHRFVGYVGATASDPRESPFSSAFVKRLNQHAGPLAEALRKADDMERAAVDAVGGASALFTDLGELTHQTAGFAAWWTDAAEARLLPLIRRMGQGTRARVSTVVKGAHVTATRLRGGKDVCIHVGVTRGEGYTLAPDALLSPRQRQVAELLVIGRSVSEVATVLECSPNTVKHHAKMVYRALGVANRAELALALSTTEGT